LQEKGLPPQAVLKKLQSRLREDLTYNSGKILGSMCNEPHTFAKQVYMNCLEKNLGDPGLFPGTAKLEQEAIQMLGSLLSNPNACGHIVSGGTEANILAMWAARNLNKKHNEVIVPVSAHISFDKAADLLNLNLIKVKLNKLFQIDVTAAENAITSKTTAIVGIAGTTELGVVDPIAELSEIAVDHDICLHVDAAFGGFVLPFLKEIYSDISEFDFGLPGVRSITMDPHKMGSAPIPAGGILFRDEATMKRVGKRVPYLAGGETDQTTLLGTRSGASTVAVWVLLKHLGRKGYKTVVKHCMNLTQKLAEGVQEIDGVSLVTQPTINIVGIKSDVVEIRLIAQELRNKGWAISLFPNHIRIVVMPHVKLLHIKNFLKDLETVVEKLSE
jgi:tyrosine decarboxylase/aspartate 1-decarboxylase